MCKTTPANVAAVSSIVNTEREAILCCPFGCPSRVIRRPKKVHFNEMITIYDVASHKDFSKEEKSFVWINDDEWVVMRRDMLEAKRLKCPTVEMSQPYRVADRKAAIQYSRAVVLREVQRIQTSLQRWNENSLGNSNQENVFKPSNLSCWNCFENRLATLYRTATKKSRVEAQESALRCISDVQAIYAS